MPNTIGDRWAGLNRLYYRRTCRRYQVVPLPNSRHTGASLSKEFADHALHLGIDTNRFDPDTVEPVTRESLSIPEKAVVFGIFARIHESKGQEQFWEGVLKLIDQSEELHLLLVGSGSQAIIDRMQALAKKYNAQDRLHLTGWTSSPERYYHTIDIAVNARIDPEPFGLSIIEAMSMRKPVLVHALGGPAETVEPGKTGWHITDPTPKGFAEGIKQATADRDMWQAMGIEARKQAIERFSHETFVNNYLQRTGEASTGP